MEAEILFVFRVVRLGKKIEAYSPVATAPRVAMPPPKESFGQIKILTVFQFARSNYLWRLLKYLIWQTMM